MSIAMFSRKFASFFFFAGSQKVDFTCTAHQGRLRSAVTLVVTTGAARGLEVTREEQVGARGRGRDGERAEAGAREGGARGEVLSRSERTDERMTDPKQAYMVQGEGDVEAGAAGVVSRSSRRTKILLGTGVATIVIATTLALSLTLGVESEPGSAHVATAMGDETLTTRQIETNPEWSKCALSVDVAQYFNISAVPGTDSTVVLNKHNERAYVLTPREASDEAVLKANLTESGLVPASYSVSYMRTPLENVTVAETQLITYVELLGARSAIASYSQYATSPCLMKMGEEGLATNFSGNVYDFSGDQLQTQPGPVFVGYSANGDIAPETVQFAVSMEQREGSMLATSEWIKFFAPFFGKECEAQQIYDSVKERYECHKAKAARFAQDFDPIKVAVVSKSDAYDYGPGYQSDGYFKVSDAGYWKSYVEDAAATPLVSTEAVEGLTATPTGGYQFQLNDTAGFHAVLSQADIVIDESYMPGGATAEKILEAYGITDPSQFKFAQSKALWRVDRRVNDKSPMGDDWFESRYPEADVLLEDVIFALHPNYSGLILNPKHQLTWLRNMYKVSAILLRTQPPLPADPSPKPFFPSQKAPQQEILTASMCEDVSAPQPLIADSCTSFKLN